MEPISPKLHGYLDYAVGLLITASPKIFGFAKKSKMATYVPVIIGTTALAYGLLTKYKPGLIKIIPMRLHLLFDELGGIFMAASPWLLGFKDKVKIPHLVMGLVELGTAFLTRTRSARLG